MSKPLDGVKVIEVASMAAAPSAAVILADFGAEVIKIEPPSGDPWRFGHMVPGMPPSETAYTTFIHNRSKKSVALDLKNPQARSVLNKLIEPADIFITNSPIRVAEKLRHAYDDVRAINPKIIYASINGFGFDGPARHKPGFDMTSWYAESGLMEEFRADGEEPVKQPVTLGDMSTAMSLYAAITTALFHRERTGEGAEVSTSLLQTGIWGNAGFLQPALVGAPPVKKYPNAEFPSPLTSVHYKTKDGRYIVIVELNPNGFATLVHALNADYLIEDERFTTTALRAKHCRELIAKIQELIGAMETPEVVERLQNGGTNFGLCKTSHEVVQDDNAIANKCFPEVEGTTGVRTVANPIRISGVEPVQPKLPPEIGGDTVDVLKQVGYSDEEIQALTAAKAIGVS